MELEQVYDRIRRMTEGHWRKKPDGFLLRDADFKRMCRGLNEEVFELAVELLTTEKEGPHRHNAALYELADVMCIALHILARMEQETGQGVVHLSRACFEKLDLRFEEVPEEER